MSQTHVLPKKLVNVFPHGNLYLSFYLFSFKSVTETASLFSCSEAQVEDSENVLVLKEGGRHSLVISHVCSESEGFYTAIAHNLYGKVECTAELYMQEPRAAITSHM